jgi:hypothetical protein
VIVAIWCELLPGELTGETVADSSQTVAICFKEAKKRAVFGALCAFLSLPPSAVSLAAVADTGNLDGVLLLVIEEHPVVATAKTEPGKRRP